MKIEDLWMSLRSVIIKMESTPLYLLKSTEYLNPGPDRSPLRSTHKLGLQSHIGNISIHARVAPGRALGILGILQF